MGFSFVVSGDDDLAPRERCFDQRPQEAVVGSAETEVDNVRPLSDCEIEGFCEAETVANRRSTLAALLPAGAKAKEPRSGRNASDSDSIVALGRNYARDPGPMVLGNLGLPRNEIAIDQELPGEIRVRRLDAAIDHCNPDAAARGDPVEVRQLPGSSRWLNQIKRVVV
jgi:hypothetical protein